MAVEHTPLGNNWLKIHYKLNHYSLSHLSYLGTRPKTAMGEKGEVIEIYPPSYAIEDTAIAHIEFGIKYDDVSLDFLRAIFKLTSAEELTFYIRSKPKGIYQRKIGYLYEFLTQQQLPVEDLGKINYVDLLDPDQYITGNTIKIPRWGINDNMLGTVKYCPIIRKTNALEIALQPSFEKLIQELNDQFPTDIFHRAVNYLYTKETRSSYQIEKEEPSPERMDRFIRILERAGEEQISTLLHENNLTRLQNEIVDPRFAVNGFRNDQNYIGQTTQNLKQIFHYVCPPPDLVPTMMAGLIATAVKSGTQHAIVQAAAVAFGFVFIHPFEDGNGRIHRFLIHDFLTRKRLVEKGMIIPVSAHMLNHIKQYDEVLEAYSKPLMRRIKYDVKDDQSITVTNTDEVEGYFRYPDLTDQTVYLANIIQATITEDIYSEMDFLMKYDEVKHGVQQIVDLPDRLIDLMIRLLHQNKGKFPKRRRKDFDKVTDDEIERMETVFGEVFELGG